MPAISSILVGAFGPVRMRPMQAEKLDVPTPLAISRSIQVL
jgi:hypothetical protein